MAEDFSEMRRDISIFLSSLRQSIDRPFRGRPPTAEVERERFMRTMMLVEEARIRFNMYTRYREEPTVDEWVAVRSDLLAFTKAFQHADTIDPDVYDRRFIVGPIMSRDRDNPSLFMQRLMPDRKNGISVAEALIAFRAHLEDARFAFSPVQGDFLFGDLERIVPRQQVAPVQFDVQDDRIVVTSRSPRRADADKDNIKSALEHIKGSGEQLVNNLENSNCDKRLLESVKELQSQLNSDGNIVKIGLTNMACGIMSAQFQGELPDAIVAMFNAYSASISLYVSQFPEWDQFTQKAAAIDLDEDDIVEVDIAAGNLISILTDNPQLADPEVPKTIAFVRQFLNFPGASSKRAAFAMVRTIENLVSSILRHSISFFNKTAEKTVEEGSTLASKVIVGLLGIALMGASGIGPAAVRAGAPWVKQAAEIVQKHIDKAAE
jgi:hypothetical protein